MIGYTQNWLGAIGRMLSAAPRPATSYTWSDRWSAYAAYDSYYSNVVYERLVHGGYRDYINQELGNAAAADIQGFYNPVNTVVDLYLNVFGGRFGEQIPIIREAPAPGGEI